MERFSQDADGSADGARLGLTSVWKGSADPAPSGPYGHVHLPPVDLFDLTAAVEALVLVNELQSWAEAQKAKLVERIREHYRGEARSGHDDETVAEEESSSLAAEEIGVSPERRAHAVLEGYGPTDAETAASPAGHAPSFIRIPTHPATGAALTVGRERYRLQKHLQDWVRLRDKTCRHPGCNRTATATEIDHTIPWHKGGPTDHNNLACLCREHHMLKTKEHWNYTQPEPGLIIATSPAGKTYTTQPPPF